MVTVEIVKRFLAQEIFITFIGFDGGLHHAWGVLEGVQGDEVMIQYTDDSQKVISVKLVDIKEIKRDGKHGN